MAIAGLDRDDDLAVSGQRAEIRGVIEEQGAVTVTCEFCQKPYRFDPIDAEQLFNDSAPKGSDSIN